MSTHPKHPWFSLFKLWQHYLADTTLNAQGSGLGVSLKQADRWLSYYFKTHPNHGKRERRFLTQWFFAGVRHLLLALFCEEVLSRKTEVTQASAWLEQQGSIQKIVERIQSLPGPRFFDWIRLRCGDTEIIPTAEILYTY